MIYKLLSKTVSVKMFQLKIKFKLKTNYIFENKLLADVSNYLQFDEKQIVKLRFS